MFYVKLTKKIYLKKLKCKSQASIQNTNKGKRYSDEQTGLFRCPKELIIFLWL
jgi:hypothetical protein